MEANIGKHFFSKEDRFSDSQILRFSDLKRPLIMGILNLTPDSFYDGGSHNNIDDILRHCEKMLSDGADIIDIGAFSSRPGMEVISAEEETSRLLPSLIEIRRHFPSAIISIDTFRKDVAYNAINNGANIINDISGGEFDKKMLKLILKYGVPAGVQNSVIALANVFVQSNINTFGNDAMAGCGTYSKLEGFAFLPVTCFTMALTTFVGQNLGAKKYERAKKGATFGVVCSLLLAEVIGVLMFFFMPYLARLFSDDINVINIASKQAKTICLFYFLLAFSHCIAAICRGAGKAIVPMIVMLAIWCVLRVTYINIAMSIAHEIRLVFLAYPLTWFISSIIYFIYYLLRIFCFFVKKHVKKPFC